MMKNCELQRSTNELDKQIISKEDAMGAVQYRFWNISNCPLMNDLMSRIFETDFSGTRVLLLIHPITILNSLKVAIVFLACISIANLELRSQVKFSSGVVDTATTYARNEQVTGDVSASGGWRQSYTGKFAGVQETRQRVGLARAYHRFHNADTYATATLRVSGFAWGHECNEGSSELNPRANAVAHTSATASSVSLRSSRPIEYRISGGSSVGRGLWGVTGGASLVIGGVNPARRYFWLNELGGYGMQFDQSTGDFRSEDEKLQVIKEGQLQGYVPANFGFSINIGANVIPHPTNFLMGRYCFGRSGVVGYVVNARIYARVVTEYIDDAFIVRLSGPFGIRSIGQRNLDSTPSLSGAQLTLAARLYPGVDAETVQFQWQKETDDLSWGNLDGETRETMVFESLSIEDVGYYRVKIEKGGKEEFSFPAEISPELLQFNPAMSIQAIDNRVLLSWNDPEGFLFPEFSETLNQGEFGSIAWNRGTPSLEFATSSGPPKGFFRLQTDYTVCEPLVSEGGLRREVYKWKPGAKFPLTVFPPYRMPDRVDHLTHWDESLVNSIEEGGAAHIRVLGVLTAPQTGDYAFYVASDSKADLYLSSTGWPTESRLVARCPYPVSPRNYHSYTDQKSIPIHLEKGARYYLEIQHEASSPDAHLSIQWMLPDGAVESPISPGHFLPQ